MLAPETVPRKPLTGFKVPFTGEVTSLYPQYPTDPPKTLFDSIQQDEDIPAYSKFLNKIKSTLPGQMPLYPDQIFFPGYSIGQVGLHDGQSDIFRDKQRIFVDAVREQVNKVTRIEIQQRMIDIRKTMGTNAEFGEKYLPYFDKILRKTQKISLHMISVMIFLAYRLNLQLTNGITTTGNNLLQDTIYQHVHDAILLNMFPQNPHTLATMKLSPLIIPQRALVGKNDGDINHDIAKAYNIFKMQMKSTIDTTKLPKWYSKVLAVIPTPVLAVDLQGTQLFIDGSDDGKFYNSSDPLLVYQYESSVSLTGKLNASLVYSIEDGVENLKTELRQFEVPFINASQTEIDAKWAQIIAIQDSIQQSFLALFDRYQQMINVVKYAQLLPLS